MVHSIPVVLNFTALSIGTILQSGKLSEVLQVDARRVSLSARECSPRAGSTKNNTRITRNSQLELKLGIELERTVTIDLGVNDLAMENALK